LTPQQASQLHLSTPQQAFQLHLSIPRLGFQLHLSIPRRGFLLQLQQSIPQLVCHLWPRLRFLPLLSVAGLSAEDRHTN